MNPSREKVRADRLARKAAQAMELDPALVEAAVKVHDALIQHNYDAWLGQNGSQHIVSVRSVKADEKPRIEGLSNRALGRVDQWPDVRVNDSTTITVTMREDRQRYELEREIDRKGEGGWLHVMDAQGRYTTYGEGAGKPVAALGYDE